ncbi:MAG TPA: molybdenum cofactor guanylyltransferase [Gemmatales bacterium]|nr:molybdenum cofactor guanylyltransferase [Gemmatales bacterium]
MCYSRFGKSNRKWDLARPAVSLLAGCLFCGGLSRRMGRDKAWLPWHGLPLAVWQAERLTQVMPSVILLAGPGQPLPPLPESIRVLRDAEAGLGPRAALIAALSQLQDPPDFLFTLAVDMVWFDLKLLPTLQAHLVEEDAVVCQSAGRLQPLGALYRTAALQAHGLPRQEAGESGSMMGLLHALRTAVIPEAAWQQPGIDGRSFESLNHPEDYAAALKSAGPPATPLP